MSSNAGHVSPLAQICRQFLVSWISLLDSVPDSQMVEHLPEFLDPLFNILDDPCPEISTLCDNLLGEFLSHIIDKPEVSDSASCGER